MEVKGEELSELMIQSTKHHKILINIKMKKICERGDDKEVIGLDRRYIKGLN